MGEGKAGVDPKLLEILVCPLTKGPLRLDPERQELISDRGEARLSHSRRHPDHAGRRGTRPGRERSKNVKPP